MKKYQMASGTGAIKSIILGLLLLCGCSQDIVTIKSNPYENDATIEEAQKWYVKNVSGSPSGRTGVNKGQTPNWKKAKDEGSYIELPFLFEGKVSSSALMKGDYSSISETSEAKDRKEVYGQSKLLLYKFENDYIPFVVRIVPTDEYANKNKSLFKDSQLTVKSLREIKFTGVVTYYNLSGEFTGGYQLLDGINYGVLKAKPNSDSEKKKEVEGQHH